MWAAVRCAGSYVGAVDAGQLQGVFMDPVQEALDDAEGDETSNVDPIEGFLVLDAPRFERLTLVEGGVQGDES